jgi:hypothetical protein
MFRNHTLTCLDFYCTYSSNHYCQSIYGGNERFDKEHDELVNPSYTILDNRLKSLEFLSTNVPLTPHQIGIG